MRLRTLALLALATLAAVLLAWALQRGPAPVAAGQRLPARARDPTQRHQRARAGAGGRRTVPARRAADGWQAPAKGGYRVDAGELRQFLVRLADARIVETKTANPALHDRLGVEALDGRPGSGVLLRLEGVAALPPLFIGQRETRGLRGTYVRRGDEDTALLVDQDLQPEREPLGWLERDLLDIPPEEIVSLEIAHPDGEVLAIDRDELGIFRIAPLPEGYRPSGPTAAESVVRALSGLRLDDVRPLAGWEPEGPLTVATFMLQDGVRLEARSWETEGPAGGVAFWVAFAAGEAVAANEAAGARADELNARLGPWLYRLPAWKHEQLARRSADLLVPLED
jgi:hypothetical protein